jgi:hypothetical protein
MMLGLCVLCGAVSAVAQVAGGSRRLNVTPGSWSVRLVVEGPDGQSFEIVDGVPTGALGDQLSSRSRSPQERKLAEESLRPELDCFGDTDILTVDQLVAQFGGTQRDDFGLTSMKVLEATPTKVRMTGVITSRFGSPTAYTGAVACGADFKGDAASMQCLTTWQTPPHTGKKSNLTYTMRRVGSCVPESRDAEADESPVDAPADVPEDAADEADDPQPEIGR